MNVKGSYKSRLTRIHEPCFTCFTWLQKQNQTTGWGHWAHMANWNLNYAKQSNLHGKGITSDKILRYLSFDFACLCIFKNRNSTWLTTKITTNKTRRWSCQKWFHLTMNLVHSLAHQKWFTFSNRDLGNLGVALILVPENKGGNRVTIIITYHFKVMF